MGKALTLLGGKSAWLGDHLKCQCSNARNVGSKWEELVIFVQVQVVIILGSQRRCRKTPMTKVIQWTGTDSLGRAGWEGKERELPFMRKNNRHTWGSALGWMMSQWRGYGLEGRQTWVMLSWVSATGRSSRWTCLLTTGASITITCSCLHGTL